ncbi:hypothetical protein [Roseateles saccharophilus]|uniref:Uncharacterized protein n=1 Tax=Roseateles saccharophilus TaxID=304 RepID=A0A4R3ULJ6_ROSSA|nr:hypothetical protein [Roseateles saccharophilus]MDG0834128.1 hypothetical protein [Roseateles saccharophilus]TCU91350.1 hypothetical protein EV671_102668 [Roseateles saccharophilus]
MQQIAIRPLEYLGDEFSGSDLVSKRGLARYDARQASLQMLPRGISPSNRTSHARTESADLSEFRRGTSADPWPETCHRFDKAVVGRDGIDAFDASLMEVRSYPLGGTRTVISPCAEHPELAVREEPECPVPFGGHGGSIFEHRNTELAEPDDQIAAAKRAAEPAAGFPEEVGHW